MWLYFEIASVCQQRDWKWYGTYIDYCYCAAIYWSSNLSDQLGFRLLLVFSKDFLVGTDTPEPHTLYPTTIGSEGAGSPIDNRHSHFTVIA